MFISFPYMFRATTRPSSGEIIVSMRHLVFVTLCGYFPGMQGGMSFTPPCFIYKIIQGCTVNKT